MSTKRWARLSKQQVGPRTADASVDKDSDAQDRTVVLWASGVVVDDLIMQLVGLRYTEPDMTISYPGFLYLLLKLETMICEWESNKWVWTKQ